MAWFLPEPMSGASKKCIKVADLIKELVDEANAILAKEPLLAQL